MIKRCWEGLLERLKMTALVEGEEMANDVWSYVAEGAPKLGVPTIQVLFIRDLRTLTIINALVWGPGDDDPDAEE